MRDELIILATIIFFALLNLFNTIEQREREERILTIVERILP